jgi:hypothetical protein
MVCLVCGGDLVQPLTGRPRLTCGDRCRKRLARRSEFRDTARRLVEAPSVRMSSQASIENAWRGGRRTRLVPPSAEQVAYARYVDGLLVRVFASSGSRLASAGPGCDGRVRPSVVLEGGRRPRAAGVVETRGELVLAVAGGGSV